MLRMSMGEAWTRDAEIVTNNVTDLKCGSPVRVEYEELASWVDFFTRDMITILGIFGNAIIIMIRMQMHLRNTFNKLLVALAFFDNFTLIIYLAISICKTAKMFRFVFPYFIWPLGNFAVRGSCFMTVVIAYERFMAVRHPLNFNRGKKYRVVRYVTFVIILDIILSVPKFLEVEPDDCNGIRFTKLYVNKIYSMYNIVLYALMPQFNISVLIYLYAKIYCDIKDSHVTQERHSITCSNASGGSTRSRESMRKKERKQAGIFAGVVFTFIVCRIPDVFVTIVGIIKYNSSTEPPLWFLITLKIRNTCIVLNSALNIVIYTWVSKQFRDDFKAAFFKFFTRTSTPPQDPDLYN